MEKITLEETQQYFTMVGLTIVDELESKGIDYRYKCQDNQGYLYARSLRSVKHQLKTNKTTNIHIFSIKNPYYYDNMIRFIQYEVSNGTQLLTPKHEIQNVDQPLLFRCGECGREYHNTWHGFMSKKEKCCSFCFNRKKQNRQIAGNHIDSNKFHLAAQQQGLIILDGPQICYHDKIIVQDNEGYRGVIYASRLLSGSSFERFSLRNPFTIDNLRIYAHIYHWDCIIYNQEYKGDKTPLRMLCSCGNEFTVDTNHFIAGKFQCNECRMKQSHIAKTVQNYLDNKQIHYTKEFTFSDCKNIRSLPFDFYLTDYNACIEVDGIGHFRPVAFGGQKDKAKLIYNQRVQNDKIKTDYCKNNHIPLLRLPFWMIEQNQYQESIDNFILSIESNDFN